MAFYTPYEMITRHGQSVEIWHDMMPVQGKGLPLPGTRVVKVGDAFDHHTCIPDSATGWVVGYCCSSRDVPTIVWDIGTDLHIWDTTRYRRYDDRDRDAINWAFETELELI